MFSNVVVKSVSSCGVYCVPCTARHTIHTTEFGDNSLINSELATIQNHQYES